MMNPRNPSLQVSRRQFLGGAAAFATGLAAAPRRGFSATTELVVGTRVLDVKGKAATVYGISANGQAGGLTLTYGDNFDVRLTNTLKEDTLLHWHGLTPPLAMDGVPMLSGPAMAPGETRSFSFPNRLTGTHWMHSHVGLQEQRLLAAPLIVKEAGEPLVDEQEHVVMLHDFTFRDPEEILAELRKGGGAHAAHSGMAGMDHSKHNTAGSTSAMPAMQMASDVSFDAMLANDRTLDDPEIVVVEKAGRVRLRIINAAAATNFWIDLGELEGELIAVDGHAIEPVKASRMPLAIAQRADIRLALPAASGAWPILFRAEGGALQSGIILKAGTAAVSKISDTGIATDLLDLSFEARLSALAETSDTPVSRTEFVMLTGGGADYQWGLNGKSEMHAEIFRVRQGERYEVAIHNMTGMAHPMHLHGHYFRVVGINGQRINGALRDTVLVPVNAMVSIQFDADNPGTWAFHCHHAYHMNAGMMGTISYTSAA